MGIADISETYQITSELIKGKMETLVSVFPLPFTWLRRYTYVDVLCLLLYHSSMLLLIKIFADIIQTWGFCLSELNTTGLILINFSAYYRTMGTEY